MLAPAREPGQVPAAEALERLAKASGAFRVVVSTEPRESLTAQGLGRFKAVLLCPAVGHSLGEDGRKALAAWLEKGGGLVEVCDPSPELSGARTGSHAFSGKVGITLHDPRHPATVPVRPYWKVDDGLRVLDGFDAKSARVLLSLDVSSVPAPSRKPVHVPAAWVRARGAGRLFFTALGRQDATWKDPLFLEHILGGIQWVLGQKQGEAAPNPDVSAEMQKLAERAASASGPAPRGEPGKESR